MKALTVTTLAVLALALAGCDKADTPTQGTAGGQLLPRSTTDEMLPYDTVQSMPSLAPQEVEGEGRPRGQASGKAEENEDVVVDAAEPAAPAAAAG